MQYSHRNHSGYCSLTFGQGSASHSTWQAMWHALSVVRSMATGGLQLLVGCWE